jgi:ribonucleoside-triphosphate reductase
MSIIPLETQIIDGEWVLGENFIAQYRNRQPNWGFDGLGWVVYVRTYAREKADGTLESIWETAERVTLGNFNIPLINGEIDPTVTKEEVERFYHLFFNLAIAPPGRGWWMSGTEYAKTNGDALNNCWYIDVKPLPRRTGEDPKPSTPFVFTFDQAMKGGGVGAGIYSENVSQFPVTTNTVELQFVVKENHPVVRELDDLGISYMHSYKEIIPSKQKSLYFKAPDSREGWDDSLAVVIDSHFDGTTKVYVDLSDIRPRGVKIKRFGGTASGPAPLAKGLLQINSIFNRAATEQRKITTVEAGDCIQIIGTVVVAGNVRRTALILLGDEEDTTFIESKDYSKMGLEPSQWRWASNNSVRITVNTARKKLMELAEGIYYNGEPGIFNIDLSKNYGRIIDGYRQDIDGEVTGLNPCGEVTLPSGEPCNLFEINMLRCHELGIDWEEAAYLAARYTYRVTFMPYEWNMSRENVYKNRRLGVGVTGVADYLLIGCNGNDGKLAQVLDQTYKAVRETNKEHAKALGTKPSIKVSTVKPSGSMSKVMGVSAGQHLHWDRYFIQRMRIAADAPVMDLIYRCGYPVEPVINGRKEDGTPNYDHTTCVVEFPVKAPTAEHPNFKSSFDVSLADQARMQAILQTYWSDNAVSATLSFHKNNENPQAVIDEIAEVLIKYQTIFKSTSLLPHAVGTYDQMPWESITKEEYEARVSRINGKPWDFIDNGLKHLADVLEDECTTGACPIR